MGRTNPPHASAASWWPRLALLAILAATALLRLHLTEVPLERDEGEYAYMGQLILAGEVPYLAAHNMKLPGVYYAYAGILSLFGETDTGVHLGLLLINLVAIVLVYLLGRALLDVATALTAAATWATLSLNHSVVGFAANAEHFVVVPMLGGVLLLARLGTARRLQGIAAAGALLGLAYVMKQHAAAFVAFGGLWLLATGLGRGPAWRRKTAIECIVFAVAAVAPFALTCLALYRAGAFSPFWFWTFTYARQYATLNSFGTGMGELGRQVANIVGSAVALWLLAGIGLTALWWDEEARRRAGFIGSFAVFSFLAICPGLRFSDHYFILLLPAASLLAGVGVSALARATSAWRPGLAPAARLALPSIAVALTLAQERAYLMAPSPAVLSRMVNGGNPFSEAIEVAGYLRQHAAVDDRVVVLGSEPQIYFYAGRRAGTSYMYMYPLMESQPFARQMQEDLIAQLERERPRFLVMVNVDTSWTRGPDSPPLLFDWAQRVLNQDYEAEGVAEMTPGQPTLYRWGADARGAAPRSASYIVTFRRRS